jgi:hypothetical protein
MNKGFILKALWICIILFILTLLVWYVAYAQELGPSPRQIHNANRRIENEGGVHTENPLQIRIRKRKKVYIYKCIDSDTKEEIPCPDSEEEEDPTERTYME